MHLTVDKQQSQHAVVTPQYDVVIVGAGPYGLSTAAHLQERGLKFAIFGKPMGFWRDHMPKGMRMRSHWWATNLSTPHKHYRLEHYAQEQGPFEQDPFWLDTFIDYGLWFQKRVAPTVDETYVAGIERKNAHFEITLVDGRVIHSLAVVMAVGLAYYAHRPDKYMQHLPAHLISHIMDHNAVDHFANNRVVVIGGGQSAFETAALMYEAGARVDLVIRRPIRWVAVQNPHIPALLRTLRAPLTGLGVGWSNVFLEKTPYLFHKLPRTTKDYYLSTRHIPAASPWLKERVIGKVSIHDDVQVREVQAVDDDVHITFSNGKDLQADHVLLATGYLCDVRRLPMLHPSIVAAVQTYMGSPILNSRFESTVPGLYFLGFSAQRSFGPLYRFVLGVEAAASRIAHAVSRQVASAK
ncbi:MAG: NAD(P)-binding domain-containing protein [Ktedonobacteraceae bacterium]|nr:NAD(P)-binding domain-containing protein [Ktedonobacteraceae bacterium]